MLTPIRIRFSPTWSAALLGVVLGCLWDGFFIDLNPLAWEVAINGGALLACIAYNKLLARLSNVH